MIAPAIRFLGGRHGAPSSKDFAALRAGAASRIERRQPPAAAASCRPQVLYSRRVAFPPHLGSTQPGAVSVSAGGTIDGCYPSVSVHQAKALAETLNRDLTDLGPDAALSAGLVDVHCHLSELGRDWEGYRAATRAAAAGGVTTLMGMPLNSVPATTTADALAREVGAAARGGMELMADVGLWGGAVPSNAADPGGALSELLDGGAFGLKAFLAPLPPDAGYEAITPDQLAAAAETCGGRGKPLLVHCELMTEEERDTSERLAYSELGDGYGAHLASRPARWERDAVRTVCGLADSCHMHVVHLSDAGCLDIIKEAKERLAAGEAGGDGARGGLTVETCPHYLLFNSEDLPDGDNRYKCFPPIRTKENQARLWRHGLDSPGVPLIDMVASDHSPCRPDLRRMEEGSLRRAWGGLSGLQYQLAATVTAHKRYVGASGGNEDDTIVRRVAEWWSEAPSRLVPGLASIKGTIRVGQQADFCAWDPTFVGNPSDYGREHHRWTGGSVYPDMLLQGRVMGTWLCGVQVYDGEKDAFVAEGACGGGVGSILLSCK